MEIAAKGRSAFRWWDRLGLTRQFALTALVMTLVLGLSLNAWLSQTIREVALDGARAESRYAVEDILLTRLRPEDLEQPMSGEHLADFDHFVRKSVLSRHTVRIKIWNRKGQIVYSDDLSLIGAEFPVHEGLAAALAGRVTAAVSGTDRPENVSEAGEGPLLEVYIPLVFPGSREPAGAFEVYRSYEPVAAQTAALGRSVTASLAAGLTLLYFSLVWVVWGGARTISRQQQALERALTEQARSEGRFRSLVQNLSDIIMVIGPDDGIAYVSPSLGRILGQPAANLQGTDFVGWLRQAVHPEDLGKALQFADCLKNGPCALPARFRVRHQDGTWRWLEAVGSDLTADPAVKGMVVTARDVTDTQIYEEELRRRALYDGLTGLPNRTLFIERLGHALLRSGRQGRPVAVLFLDLDNFKLVNDSLGHQVGDELLTAVAERLRQCLRREDTLARFGGDEFTVLLEEVPSAEGAIRVAERIHDALAGPFTVDGHELFLTASIGIALSRPETLGPEELLQAADIALYQAKALGKARSALFGAEMAIQVSDRLRLSTDLRRAIGRGEFRVHYQPVVDLETGRVGWVEALVRWHHPERGLLPPSRFIAIAEETGLIIALGRLILREACRQVQAWQAYSPGLGLSVNLSPRQFQDPALVEEVARVLAETGLDPACLELEVTEEAVMSDPQQTVNTLNRLKGLGVRIAIDDFGTGYSSLAYLVRFPVDTIKLDRSFTAQLPQSPASTAIVQAVLTFARSLGLTVVVEGVERVDQLKRVKALGCLYGQGYLLGPPQPAESLGALLSGEGRC
ncbi:MAG: hypothetical protein C4316_11500 [Chloroflexota bacterium]